MNAMQDNYLYIILVALVIAAALLFVWLRRDRARLPGEPAEGELPAEQDISVSAAEGLVGTVVPMPPEMFEPLDLPAELPRDPEAPAPAAETPVAETPAGPPDTLTTIKGLGPKAAARLNDLGITRFDQLAALSSDRLAAIDAQMGPLQGRIAKDRWVEQAGYLAAGDVAGFEATFGKLGG